MDWKNWRDYIPCSSRPAAKIPQTKEIPRDVSEEEFREDLNLTAEPEGELPWSLDGEYAPSAGKVEIRNCPRALTFRL